MDELNRQSQWQVPFEVLVCIRFDEAVEGTLWVELTLVLKPADVSGTAPGIRDPPSPTR